jgi:hypothetical protein
VSDQGSDFSIDAAQRRRLLEGDYSALQFEIKPTGCEPGARYVLAYKAASASVYKSDDEQEAFIVRSPRAAVWFLTVKGGREAPKRVWRGDELRWVVRFDVTDLRDRDVFLRPGGGVQGGRDPLSAGCVPDPDWVDSEAEAIGEHWEQERLRRVEREQLARSRSRARRNAA